MTPLHGVLVGLVGVVLMAIPLTVLAIKYARRSDEVLATGKAANAAERERDVAQLEKQQTEAQLQQDSREQAKERFAHREQLEAARKALADAREKLRRCAAPDVVDDRLRAVEDSLTPRTDPRRDDAPGLSRGTAAIDRIAASGGGGLPE